MFCCFCCPIRGRTLIIGAIDAHPALCHAHTPKAGKCIAALHLTSWEFGDKAHIRGGWDYEMHDAAMMTV